MMETNRNPLGRAIDREGLGREGGGRLFITRRQRDLERGFLGSIGESNNYLVFQPSKFFIRVVGDKVLQLNEALCQVRSRGPELVWSVGVERLQADYAKLDELVEATRDKVVAFTAYCNQGFEGHFREALESIAPSPTNEDKGAGEAAAAETDGAADSSDTYIATAAAKASKIDVFDALRERNFEQGVLTEYGRGQGCVAFQPSGFYGRFVGELVYSLNDALRRLEGLTSYYVMSGGGKTLQNYYAELENGLGRIGKDLDGIVGFCKRKLIQG